MINIYVCRRASEWLMGSKSLQKACRRPAIICEVDNSMVADGRRRCRPENDTFSALSHYECLLIYIGGWHIGEAI